jgi:hypothetical protein
MHARIEKATAEEHRRAAKQQTEAKKKAVLRVIEAAVAEDPAKRPCPLCGRRAV